MLGIFLLVMQWTGDWMQNRRDDFESGELERNCLMMMDSLVKNRDTEKPQYGAAALDGGKKRVESNRLEKQLLEKIPESQENENSPVFFQQIELQFLDGARETVFELPKKGTCLSAERLVVIENRKAVVRGAVCRE
jgi:hypothetical protein